MRRNLQTSICWLGLAVAAMGCRGPQAEQAIGPNQFRQANAPQPSWNPFTKEQTANSQGDERRSEAPPDWRSLQAMMPKDPLSLSKPVAPGANLYVKAAQLYEVKNQFPEAVDQYRKALELDSRDINALVGLARLYDRLDRPVEAAQLYEQTASLHPTNGTVFNDLGLCYSKQGRWNDALSNLDRAVQLQPKSPLYRNNIAKVLIRNGRSDDAYRHLIAVFGPAESHFNVALMAKEFGDIAAAKQHLTLALQQSPDLIPAKDLLAEITSPPSQNNRLATELAEMERQTYLPQMDAPQFEAQQFEAQRFEAPQLESPQIDQAQLDSLRLEGPQFHPTSGPSRGR